MEPFHILGFAEPYLGLAEPYLGLAEPYPGLAETILASAEPYLNPFKFSKNAPGRWRPKVTILDIKGLLKNRMYWPWIFFDFLRPARAARGSAVKCAEILVPSGAGKPLGPESSYPSSPGTTSSRL